jgi:hypothetical protein
MPSLVYVLNGPNLNMLGVREPAIYGSETLADLRSRTEKAAANNGLKIDFRQSNVEGEIVTWVQEAREKAKGIIINAGAYTHTSVAILDALQASELPVIDDRGAPLEYLPPRSVSSAFLHFPCGNGRHLRPGQHRVRTRGRGHGEYSQDRP